MHLRVHRDADEPLIRHGEGLLDGLFGMLALCR